MTGDYPARREEVGLVGVGYDLTAPLHLSFPAAGETAGSGFSSGCAYPLFAYPLFS